MGKIFPMASLVVRLGFVRKREKEARRAAEAQRLPAPDRNTIQAPPLEAKRTLLAASPRQHVTGLHAYNAHRSRESRRKADAKRRGEEGSVIAAIRALEKDIRENVRYIDRWAQDDGRVALANDELPIGIEDVPFGRKIERKKPSDAFSRLTEGSREALRAVMRKHRGASARLRSSIDAVLAAYRAALERYEKIESSDLIRSKVWPAPTPVPE